MDMIESRPGLRACELPWECVREAINPERVAASSGGFEQPWHRFGIPIAATALRLTQ